jgi:hypothetical protein
MNRFKKISDAVFEFAWTLAQLMIGIAIILSVVAGFAALLAILFR